MAGKTFKIVRKETRMFVREITEKQMKDILKQGGKRMSPEGHVDPEDFNEAMDRAKPRQGWDWLTLGKGHLMGAITVIEESKTDDF